MVGVRIYCSSSLAGRVVPLTFCSSRHSNLDINLGLLLLPVVLVISLLPCAHCCISVCLLASPLVLRTLFLGGHGAVSLLICGLQERHVRGRVILSQLGQHSWCVTWCSLSKTCWTWERGWGWVTVVCKKEVVQETSGDGAGAAKAWVPSISLKLMIISFIMIIS